MQVQFYVMYKKDTHLQWYQFEMHEYGMEHAYNDMSLKWCKLKVVWVNYGITPLRGVISHLVDSMETLNYISWS